MLLLLLFSSGHHRYLDSDCVAQASACQVYHCLGLCGREQTCKNAYSRLKCATEDWVTVCTCTRCLLDYSTACTHQQLLLPVKQKGKGRLSGWLHCKIQSVEDSNMHPWRSIPVRRCFGSFCMMASNCVLKPMSNSLSASSNTKTSSRLRFMAVLCCMMSSNLPGVPINTLAPLVVKFATSAATSLQPGMSLKYNRKYCQHFMACMPSRTGPRCWTVTHVPPTSRRGLTSGMDAKKGSATL